MLDNDLRKWTPAHREEWEERAGIIEDGCKVDRPTAERMATACMRARYDGMRQLPLFERVLAKVGNGRP